MKKFLRYLGIAIAAVIAFFVAIFVGEEEGKGEGKIEQHTQDEVAKVEEARKKGDTDAIDDVWKEK